MKILLIALGLSFANLAHANENDLKHRPKAIKTTSGNAVFVDFTEANYEITYDLNQKLASAKADILFEAPEAGLPVFDSVQTPTAILLDGQAVSSSEMSTPAEETTLRVIHQSVSTGTHRMSITVPLTELVEFKAQGVKSAFWTSDLDERQYLERYLPANFEFDQVKMNFLIKFVGGKNKQSIYTNGLVTQVDANTFKVSYPDYYTASSIFFHTVYSGAVDELRFQLKSINGRDIPAVVYTAKSSMGSNSAELQKFKDGITAVFKELEGDYGAFLHPSITVYAAGSGGMEYCGATITEWRALGHELFHSYFARGVMPANGNAGWLDEALASWRDKSYFSLDQLSGSSQMSSHAYYTRTTDMDAYTFGRDFMALLNGKFKAQGGLKPFLHQMVAEHAFAPLFVEDFVRDMGTFYNTSVVSDFKQYTFGTKSQSHRLHFPKDESIHHQMSLKELKNYL